MPSPKRCAKPLLDRLKPSVLLAAVLSAFLVVALASPPTSAGILTKILREAADAGGKAGKHGLGTLDNAAAALKKLPDGDSATALAVHATPEGHWVFANKKGDQFTAGTPDELARAPKTLLGEQSSKQPLSLYLTEDTVFQNAAKLKDLPSTAKLHIVVNKTTYPLMRQSGSKTGYALKLRPNLKLALSEKALLSEALYRFARPLNPANIRLLSLKPGGPKTLSSVPAYDPKTRRRMTEFVDPGDLGSTLRKLKGQTVVITGDVSAGNLLFQSANGKSATIALSDLSAAARSSDVNLIVLKSNSPTQPGAKNWLWQTVEVDGLETALKRPTVASFMESVAANSGDLVVETARGGQGRIILNARPTGAVTTGVGSHIDSWIAILSEQVTGSIAAQGVSLYTRDKARTQEYQLRLIPGIPSTAQILYALGLFAGLMSLSVARSWWSKIWPPEDRREYRGKFGYQAARIARLIAFIFAFLPLVGPFALLWFFVGPLIALISLPFRFIIRIFRAKSS